MSRDSDREAGTKRGVPITRAFGVPGLTQLKLTHGIEPLILVKAALAIFNVSQTKQSRAFFSSTEAGRKWPFMESWIDSQLPSPMNVAGPTLGWTFDFIDVKPSMTAGNLLQQIASAQKLSIEHCHAPWADINRNLGSHHGRLVHDIAARQVVTWNPSTKRRAQSEQHVLERLDRQALLDFGLSWNFSLESPTRMTAFAMYDDVHLERSEVEAPLERVEGLMERLSEAGAWDLSLERLM